MIKRLIILFFCTLIANCHNTNGPSDFFNAIHAKNLRSLWEADDLYHTHINDFNDLGQTALMSACENGFYYGVDFLLRSRAILEISHKINHQTPLAIAASNGHTNVLHLLLEHKANLKVADVDGNYPLHLAAMNGHLEIVKMLKAKRVELNAVNAKNETAAELALKHGHLEIANFLQQ